MNYQDPSTAFPGFDTTALNAWMEARGEGARGIQAQLNVVRNRANKLMTSMDAQVTRPGQFSWTNPKDPEHDRRPGDALCSAADMEAWEVCKDLAFKAKQQQLADITQAATLYYNPNGIVGSATHPLQRFVLPTGKIVDFPGTWIRRNVRYTVTIGRHIFFSEV